LPRTYPPAVEFLRQGDPSGEVFLVHGGLVKLLRSHPNGEKRILGLRAAGWLIGAAAAVLQRPHAVTAVTVSSCRLACVGAEEFRRLVKTDPLLSWRLHEMHSREVYDERVEAAELTAASARERLWHFLRGLAPATVAEGNGAEVRVEVPLRQWEMAQLIGVTPSYLCQLLGELDRAGVVRKEGDYLVLRDHGGGWTEDGLQLSEDRSSTI
jgi:CRP/FNR family transcriptional regulator